LNNRDNHRNNKALELRGLLELKRNLAYRALSRFWFQVPEATGVTSVQSGTKSFPSSVLTQKAPDSLNTGPRKTNHLPISF
jgi:hypothetical protein